MERRTLLATVTWTNLSGGNWAIKTNWSTGNLPGPGDDAVIPTLNSGASVTYSSGNSTVQSLTSSAGVILSGGTLTITGNLQESAGKSFTLKGGTLAGATLTSGSTLALTSGGGYLSGVTIAAGAVVNGTAAEATAGSIGGLTLDGTLALGNAAGTTYGQFFFDGTQTLSGTGTVTFGNSVYNKLGALGGTNPATLTIGAGITVKGGTGWVGGVNATDSLINRGTIMVPAGHAVAIVGNQWVNAGTIDAASGSFLNLFGSFRTAALGNIAAAGAAVNLYGTLTNTGTTLQLAPSLGNWGLIGGTIVGGTIASTGGSELRLTYVGGTLSGVTVAAGTTIDGTQLFAGPVAYYNFNAGPNDVSGNGHNPTLSDDPPTFAFAGGYEGGDYIFNSANENSMTVPLDIGPTAMPQLTMGDWFYAFGVAGQGGLLSDDNGGFDRTIDIDTRDSDGTPDWSAFNGTGVVAGGPVTAGQWTFVAVRYDQATGTMAFDVNGTFTYSETHFDLSQLNTFTIGRNPSFAAWFDGEIDDVFVYNQLLSNAQLDTIQQGARLDVTGGLTLDGTLKLGSADSSLYAQVYFDGTQSLTGTGTVILGGSAGNALYAKGTGTLDATPATLTVGAGITIDGGAGVVRGYVNARDSLVFEGAAAAGTAGETVQIGYFSDTLAGFRSIAASNGATVNVAGTLDVDGSSVVTVAPGSSLQVGKGPLGTTQDTALFQPGGTISLNGGNSTNPHLLEAMSEDLGAVPAGFTNNFAYGSLNLGNESYVRLVDQSENAPGSGPEAVYADRLVVPIGATLDLNGLHLYARDAVVRGKIINGTITQLPNSGPLTLDTLTSGAISTGGELDNWTFFGRAGSSITVSLDPGSGADDGPITP
jgi:hypothetical protein